ncbi:MAG: glycoside hydrolase family 65 protein [Myxococcales bacterium]|nr:MAG: glycoside hydrolase family 65 protein [Myxococcales bacterium]
MRIFSKPFHGEFAVSHSSSDTKHEALFPIDPWAIQQKELSLKHATLAETVFAQANGYMGSRGTFEEGMEGNPTSTEGTYLNGVFFREKYSYPEIAYAFATHNNKMIQVPNGKLIELSVDGERFVPGKSQLSSFHRSLDFRDGVLERKLRWKTESGKELELASRRLVSLENQHLLALQYTVTALDFDGKIELKSGLDASYGVGDLDPSDPRVGQLSIRESLEQCDQALGENSLAFSHRVKDGDVVIRSACRQSLSGADVQTLPSSEESSKISNCYVINLKKGQSVTLTKYLAYHHGKVGSESQLSKEAEQSLAKAIELGFDHYVDAQKEKLKSFWDSAEVNIDGDPALAQGMHFNLFHIYQSVGKDGRSNIAAKGLTGPGYDGHYFWDTEIYVIPFLVYSYPEIARKLLEFRYSILDKARERARQMSHDKGALFAWRTIGGEECSAYFPAGTAQYHINAAVAYATRQYLDATQDWDFIKQCGAEMLWETARIWMGIGHFNPRKDGKFCICEVTGPDEYSAMVDNNFYTNAMARQHLRTACEVADYLKANDQDRYNAIKEQIGLDESELESWKKAADRMYLPYDDKLGINPQDDTFLDKPKWDLANTPDEKRPLLIHFHPLVIYRHQVLKQTDVVLAMVLLGEQFEEELKRRNFEYYDPLTTHDSTLSTSMNSVACSELGLYDKAYSYFTDTARMDLDNRHGNTDYGLHAACMAGSWMTVVMGFGGMRIRGERPAFDPYLPKQWKGYSFSVCYRGGRVKVEVGAEQVRYTLQQGSEMSITHHGKAINIKANQPTTEPLLAKQR